MSSYSCSICNYTTDSKGNINKHIKRKIGCDAATIVEVVSEVECEICGKQFHTNLLLNSHKKGCVEKKTLLVPTYINKEEIDEEVNTLKAIVKSLVKRLDAYESENKDLTKRIEKLEENQKTTNDYKKKGFEILTKEQIDEELSECAKEDVKTQKIKKFDELSGIIDAKNFMQANTKAMISIIDKSGKFHGRCIAKESGVNANVDGKEKKFNFDDIDVVVSRKVCKNQIYSRILKTGLCYCEGHFDTDTGLPKD